MTTVQRSTALLVLFRIDFTSKSLNEKMALNDFSRLYQILIRIMYNLRARNCVGVIRESIGERRGGEERMRD